MTLKVLLLFLMLISPAWAELTAREVMVKIDEQRRAEGETTFFTMTLHNARGKTRVRKLRELYRSPDPQNSFILMTYIYPPDLESTGFLSIQKPEKEESWLYLPALQKAKRISGQSKQNRFVGSDFTYEDIIHQHVDSFVYRYTEKPSAETALIEVRPGPKTSDKDSAYSRKVYKIDLTRFLVVSGELYDKKGKLVKRLQTDVFKEISPNRWRADKAAIYDLERNTHTTVDITERKLTLPPNIPDPFTVRYLKRGVSGIR